MKILALDTSTEACSVALYNDGEIQQIFHHQPQQQAKLLLNCCDEILQASHLQLEQLNAIAFCHGPGSFTGLRVATAAAQGMAVAHNLPLVTVSSLALLAQGAHRVNQQDAIRVASCIDARMQEVYFAEYQFQSKQLQLLQAEQVTAAENIQLDIENHAIIFAGNGWQAYQDQFTFNIAQSENMPIWPEAQDILPIAVEKVKRGETLLPEAALPNYIRNNVAKKSAER